MGSEERLDGPAEWWRQPWMWLVVGGPATVVVAGFATLWIALRAPDPVVAEDYYRQGIEINRTLAADEALRGRMPAMAGRNHAATPAGAVPLPGAAAAPKP